MVGIIFCLIAYVILFSVISVLSHIHICDNCLGFLSLVNDQVATRIDSNISQLVGDANKILMCKNTFGDGRIETVTTEKNSFRRNTVDI